MFVMKIVINKPFNKYLMSQIVVRKFIQILINHDKYCIYFNVNNIVYQINQII